MKVVFSLALIFLYASSCWADFYWNEPYDDYKNNPIQAESKWVNMRLQFVNVDAKIAHIGKNIWGEPYLVIVNGDDKNTKVSYVFYFDDKGPYPRELLEAREGQYVKISGIVNKLHFSPSLFGSGGTLAVALSDPKFLN